MGSSPDRSAPTSVWVEGAGDGTAGLHPRIWPAIVAKMNRAAPELVPSVTTKPVPPLNTTPVGPPGTLTSSAILLPAPPYSVERFVRLSATHHGVVGPATSPHGFTSAGSTVGATPSWSETRLVT